MIDTFSFRSPEPAAKGGWRWRLPNRRSEGGFTLVEVLVAAIVLGIGITALFGLLDSSVKATASTRSREGATNLARQVLEDAHTVPYSQISPSSITGQLQAMNGLADASAASGWQVLQRGVTYTVTVSECAIDDPKDGYGKHVNSGGENPFCSDSSTEWTSAEGAEKEDSQPEDLKRIAVKVTWVAQGSSPEVRQALTLTAAGEAPGLSASALKLSAPKAGAIGTGVNGLATAPVVELQPTGNTLTFSVQAPKGTTGISWSIEGVKQTSVPTFVSGTEWTFSWEIPLPGVSDGTYQVAAQAIDATGVYGPPISISVTLVRSVPAEPKITYGGFNEINVAGKKTTVVELQWQANSERNVIGYRVHTEGSTLVCPTDPATLSLSVSCIDLNLPSEATKANRSYSVAALYRKAEGAALSTTVSEGKTATFVVEKGTPKGPTLTETSTEKLIATKNADGSVTLTWPKPTGVAAVFYRIYRGSTDYTSRYGVSATREFTDTDATTTHEYWVTAVSSSLTESNILGPVSR
jgi:prepilin-type N-terminal cleavage/methylation domain-containing protein